MGALNHRWPLVLLCLALGQHLTARQPAASAQRSLNHWRRDLEYRLSLYQHQRRAIADIIGSSILRPALSAAGNAPPGSPPPIVLEGDVRFSDLVIPSAALILSDHVARPTAGVLLGRTRDFLRSKLNDLGQIRSQIDLIDRQLLGPGGQSYIYKGARGVPVQSRPGAKIPGRRVFKQAHFVSLARSPLVQLRRVNNTDVDRVIDDTYMRNYHFGLNDAQGRLFFEGRKTFWDTTFQGPLRSGCCDRLQPLHTSRMLLRSAPQDVLAPVLIKSRPSGAGGAVLVDQLQTSRLLNRHLTAASKPAALNGPRLAPELLASPPENVIQLPGLVQIRVPRRQPEVLKTLVFREPLLVEEGFLSNSALDGRLAIGLSAGAEPTALDLAHDNYLLKFLAGPAATAPFVQIVRQPVQVNGAAHFLADLDANWVNRVDNFRQFVEEQLARLDRPTVVRGPVQFNALPSLLDSHRLAGSPSRQPQSVPVMQVDRQLEVGWLNGMRVPRDIVLLPTPAGAANNLNHNQTLRAQDVIHVRGPRLFQAPGVFHELVQVSGLVNGLHFPRDVIPLHLNDFGSSVGYAKLAFLDGITAGHLTVQSGQFDDIVLRDVAGDAQSLVMRAAIAQQADGSQLIRAPLRVANLNLVGRPLLGSGRARGRLNGIRPQEIAELVGGAGIASAAPLLGRKTFLAPVEASECLFSDLNAIANWTSHLIRIDRPQTVQTIHTKLAFKPAPAPLPTGPPGAVRVNHFDVEFQPDDSAAHHQNNWNFSPEFYLLHQALHRAASNSSAGGRYRILGQLNLFPAALAPASPLAPPPPPPPAVNGVPLHEVVTKDRPMQFGERFTMVGKVELAGGSLRANRLQSNYPLDAADLVQFDRYRIPLAGAASPVQLNNLALGADNRASFVQVRQLNGLPFGEFAASIMSLTRPQVVHSALAFAAPVELRGFVRTSSSLNGIKNFAHFARALQRASYSFENGLQCNTLVVS